MYQKEKDKTNEKTNTMFGSVEMEKRLRGGEREIGER